MQQIEIPRDILEVIAIALDEYGDVCGRRICEDQEENMAGKVRALSKDSKEMLRTSFINICGGWEETEDDDFGNEQMSTLCFALWDIIKKKLEQEDVR